MHTCRPELRRTILLPGIALLLLMVGCGRSDKESTENPGTGTADTTSAKVLSDSAWLAMGMPETSRAWTGEDLQKALEVMQKARSEGHWDLPRFKGPGSHFFHHLTSLDNLSFFQADTVSEADRLIEGSKVLLAATQIYMMYLNAAQSENSYTEEVIRLIATVLNMEEDVMGVTRRFVASVPEERRNSEQFQNGLRQMKSGLTQTVSGVIRVLRDKETFSSAQLERLATVFRTSGRELITNLDADQIAELRNEAAKTMNAVDNPVIEGTLEALFPLANAR